MFCAEHGGTQIERLGAEVHTPGFRLVPRKLNYHFCLINLHSEEPRGGEGKEKKTQELGRLARNFNSRRKQEGRAKRFQK